MLKILAFLSVCLIRPSRKRQSIARILHVIRRRERISKFNRNFLVQRRISGKIFISSFRIYWEQTNTHTRWQTHTQADKRRVKQNLLGRCNQNENTAVSQLQLATIYDTLITFVHSNDNKLTSVGFNVPRVANCPVFPGKSRILGSVSRVPGYTFPGCKLSRIFRHSGEW